MFSVRPPFLAKLIFNKAIWNLNSTKKAIYFTFDDGPHHTITPWVLKLLKSYQCKATFFCIGANIEKYNSVYEEILREEHAVGNHSFSHLNGWNTKNEKYFDDIDKCQDLLRSDLFRPPYGKMTFSQYRQLSKKYKIIMWDVLSGDYDRKLPTELIVKNVKKYARPGSIITFHDSEKAFPNLKIILPQLLEHFFSLGYNFMPINLSN